MSEVFRRIKEDIYNYKYAFAVILFYGLAANAFLGRFCPSLVLAGLPCPACGMTRAGIYLLTGHIREAFSMHAGIFPFAVLAVVFCYNRYIRGKDNRFLLKYMFLFIAVGFLYYGYRMYRMFPAEEPLIYWEHSLLRLIL